MFSQDNPICLYANSPVISGVEGRLPPETAGEIKAVAREMEAEMAEMAVVKETTPLRKAFPF